METTREKTGFKEKKRKETCTSEKSCTQQLLDVLKEDFEKKDSFFKEL